MSILRRLSYIGFLFAFASSQIANGAISVSWPKIGGSTYSVPQAGETGWANLTNYLVALQNAQGTTSQTIGVRTATTTPVTVSSANDTVIAVKLAVPGASTVNLPAGYTGQYFAIVDATGDAATNNITIDANGSQTINGALTLVLNQNRQGIVLIWTGTEWIVYAQFGSTAGGGMTNPMTTQGDIIIGGASGTPVRLAAVATGNALISGGVGADPAWGKVGLTTHVDGTLPVANGGTGVTSSTGTGNVVLSNSPALVTPALGTPASGTMTNVTGLPLTTGVTGTLPVANGGTGVTTSTGTGSVVLSSSPTLVTPALGTPSSVTLTNATGLPLTTGVTGTLPVANGGTGVTTSTGTGNTVLSNSPTLVTPALGTPSAAVLTNATGLPLISGVTGTLPTTNGGTGQSTANAGFNALAPSQSGNSGKYLTTDGTNTSWSAVSGSDSQGINYITNGSFENTANAAQPSGWVGFTDAAATTPADGTGGTNPPTGVTFLASTTSPLRGLVSAVLAKDASNRQGAGYSFDFTISAVDVSKKFQASLDMSVASGTYAAGDVRVYLYDVTNSTLLTPQTVNLPSATTSFVTTVDTTTSTSYRWIVYVSSTSASAYSLKFDSMYVGPSQVYNGAAISDWQSFTPSWTNLAVNNGTSTGIYRRNGSNIEVEASITWGSTTALTSTLGINLPSGVTLGTVTGAGQAVGSARLRDAGVVTYIGTVAINTTSGASNIATVSLYNNAADVSNTVPFTFATGDTVSVWYSVPIAEWAGSGTVNIGPGAQVEYAYNSSSSDSDDTTSFAYGPQGKQMTGALTAPRTKLVRFQYPIQTDDVLALEFSNAASGPWVDVGTSVAAGQEMQPFLIQNTNSYGVRLGRVAGDAATDIRVQFGQYRYAAGATFGAAGDAWSTQFFWRVRKAKASSPVGFGLASATDSGLVSTTTQSFAGNKTFTGDISAANLVAGRYTPTVTASTNVSAVSSVGSAHYSRVGNIVTVSGMVDITCSAAANTASRFFVTLPIASNLTSYYDLQGNGTRGAGTGTAYSSVQLGADSTNDRASVDFNATQTALATTQFTFQYEIK